MFSLVCIISIDHKQTGSIPFHFHVAY